MIATAIESAFPHPKAVARTMPSTSPIAQPVRQCKVALIAVRVRFCGAAWSTLPRYRHGIWGCRRVREAGDRSRSRWRSGSFSASTGVADRDERCTGWGHEAGALIVALAALPAAAGAILFRRRG